MLKGRESLARLVGKRRRFLPNRHSLLSLPTQSSLNVDVDSNGKLVSLDEQGCCSSNRKPQEDAAVEEAAAVTCPVCGVKLTTHNNSLINSHLDECLSRGTKRKLTQRTLLELNFSPVSKIQTRLYDSEELGKDLFRASHGGKSPVPDFQNQFVAVEDFQYQDDNLSANPINKDEINERPDFDAIVAQDDVYGVPLETFIVGRRFGEETELCVGASVHLSRDPDNVKDPNAIKILYSDSGCLKVLGFLPRKTAEYMSPLMDEYHLNFGGCVTFVPKHSIDVVPIKIVCHKTCDATDFSIDNAFKCLWRNAQQIIESTKSCPPSAMKYQENFCVIIREVLRNSSHLLTDDEKNLMESFVSMSDDSQRLFVRLYTRKGPWFRVSTISYSEVLDPHEAVRELTDTGYTYCFNVTNNILDDDIKDILDSLTASELREILCILQQSHKRGLRKQDLVASLVSTYKEGLCPLLPSMIFHRTGSCVRISSNAESLVWRAEVLSLWLIYDILEELSAFLLVDLGIVKYPTYKCIVSQQIFSSRDDMLGYEEAIQVAQIVDEALDEGNNQLVLKCIKIADSHLYSPVKSLTSEALAPFLAHFSATFVYSKVVFLGISFLEREHRYGDAIYLLKRLLSCFLQDRRRGYWTLRLSMDLEHMGYLNESLSVAEKGLLDEWVRAGSRVALQRRVLRLGKPPRRWKTPSFAESIQRKIMEVNIQGRPLNCETGMKSRFYGEDGEQCGVEQLALQYYAEEGGWQGVHSESGIWRTIFGLLMWDIIFSSVPDVFRTKFQTAPLDLETDSFYLVRKNPIESHLQKIHDGMAEEILITSWELHEGTSCRGVNWTRHSLSDLRAAVTCIGGPCLDALCRHLAQDYRSWSSGMPDLLLWRFHGNYGGEAKLVEVKGPRDKLSEQQRACLLLLRDCGFNAEVCKVSPAV